MTLFDSRPRSGAVLSPDNLYRYFLWRAIGDDAAPRRTMLFVMLNPSTADANTNDQTIGRCLDFARREHCTRLEVVNLFAWRATDPRELARQRDPVGPENLDHVASAMATADVVVAAWGAWRPVLRKADRIRKYVESTQPLCLGRTREGEPCHPSRIAKTAPLVPLRTPPTPLARG